MNTDGILPDDPSGFIPKGVPSLEFPRTALAEAEALIGSLTERVREPILTALAGAEGVISTCRACLEGDLARLAGNAEACLQKCAKKLLNKCVDSLTSAYAALANAGGAYPTQEDVIYGLETSDYTGSVGLSARLYDAITDAVGATEDSGSGPIAGSADENGGAVVVVPPTQSVGDWGGGGGVPVPGGGSPGPVGNHSQGGLPSVPPKSAGTTVGSRPGSVQAVLEGTTKSVQAASQTPRKREVIAVCPGPGPNPNPDVELSVNRNARGGRLPSGSPPPSGVCCIAPENLLLVSGYSQSGTSGGTGLPWDITSHDIPTNGYFVGVVSVCENNNTRLQSLAWPNGAVLALDPSGNLIYTFGGSFNSPQTCLDPNSVTFIPPGQQPPQPPLPPLPPGPQPEAGDCIEWKDANISPTVPTNGIGQTDPFLTHPSAGILVSRPVAESGAMGWGCRWRVALCNTSTPNGPPTFTNVAAPDNAYPAIDPNGLLWFVKDGVVLPGDWTFPAEGTVVDIGGCAPGPPLPPVCDPDFPQCFVPLPPQCPPEQFGLANNNPVPSTPRNCEDWDKYIAEMIKVFTSPARVMAFPFLNSPASDDIQKIIGMITGRKSPIIPDLVSSIGTTIQKACEDAAKITGCDLSKYLPIVLQQGLSEFVEKWTGTLPTAYMQRLQYMANQVCQYLLPSASDADAAYMMGTINERDWDCWQRLNGMQLPEARLVRDSKRTKPNVHEIITLNVRGHIDDATTRKLCKELGVVKDEEFDRFKRLIEAFPGIDDIFRLMVRDVVDEEIVTKFQLDADFDKKWKGKLKDYAKGQGITDELAKYMWRAHWQYPSNTQAFEALHKLRPNKPGIDPNIATTSEDIKRLITANDMSPFWVERLMASSYHTLTRVDTTRAYELGVLDKEGVVNSYQDGGYNEANARILADVAEVNLKRKRRNALGLPGPKKLFASLVANEIAQTEFEIAMIELGFSGEEIGAAIVEAGTQRSRLRRKKRIAMVRKSFLTGGMDATSAVKRLNELNLDATQITDHINDWTFQKETETKLVNLGQLCSWFSNRLISAEDYLSRIRNMGFSPEDVGRIAQSCGIVASEKERKAAEKAAKEQEQQAAKAAAADAKRIATADRNVGKARKEYDEADLLTAKMVDKIIASGQTPPGEGEGGE